MVKAFFLCLHGSEGDITYGPFHYISNGSLENPLEHEEHLYICQYTSSNAVLNRIIPILVHLFCLKAERKM